MTQLITTKRLMLAVMLGTIAIVMQSAFPGIPLGVGGAKLELADIPVVLGATVTGPVGGVICGILYGISSPAYLALIPSMVLILGVIGYLSDKRNGWFSIIGIIVVMRIVVGPLISGALFNLIYFTTNSFQNVWLLCLGYAAPGAVLCIATYPVVVKRIPALLSANKEKNREPSSAPPPASI